MTSRREPSRLPIRGTIGLGVTAASLAFLLTLRAPGTTGSDLALVADATDEGATISGPASPGASAAASASASASASATALPSPSSGAVATTEPAPSTQPSATVGPTATAAPTATAVRSATLVGDVVATRFGDVQVQVTVEGGAIVDVVALRLPDEDRRSLRISEQVESILAEMAISAQSADIDTISGATYTSRAYEQSLQSALDQLAA